MTPFISTMGHAKSLNISSAVNYLSSPISFRSLFWFDLGLLAFHENSNHGRENYWKSGVQIPAPEGPKNFVLFSFFFQFLHIKLGIFEFNHYLVWLIRNQIKHGDNLCFYLDLICFVIQDIQKWLKRQICSFLWWIWKWKEKRTKKIWPSGAGIWTLDFENFPAHDLNFHGKWGSWDDI